MIIAGLLIPVFALIDFIITLIPSFNTVSGTPFAGFYDFIGIGLYFFGTAPFILVISSVLFWSGVELAWSIIEWIYVKIPGVN